MSSVKLEGSITLPDGTTTGPFTINIPLLPTTVARHITSVALPVGAGHEPADPPAAAEVRHGQRHGSRHS